LHSIRLNPLKVLPTEDEPEGYRSHLVHYIY
jgi:hypothetical protein